MVETQAEASTGEKTEEEKKNNGEANGGEGKKEEVKPPATNGTEKVEGESNNHGEGSSEAKKDEVKPSPAETNGTEKVESEDNNHGEGSSRKEKKDESIAEEKPPASGGSELKKEESIAEVKPPASELKKEESMAEVKPASGGSELKKEGSTSEVKKPRSGSRSAGSSKENSNSDLHQKQEAEKKKKFSLLGLLNPLLNLKRGKEKEKEAAPRSDQGKENNEEKPNKKEETAETEQTGEEQSKERKIIVISKIEDFPEDCQKLIEHAQIPREKMEANFKILMNVLHFRSGKIFKTPETANDPPRPSLPKSTRLKKPEELLTDVGEFKKQYKDVEELGKGGFGSVVQARCKDKKRLVAIKKMEHKTRKQKAANFHEASILSLCNHNNIVKYFGCHELKDELLVVMELMEGGTFEDAARAWHFNEANIAYIARELLKGIAYLHKNQFAHRDLKSANIMMSVRGEVKIIDLGLCADMSVGFPTHMVGSPFWMPPEMIQCKPHGYAVDIWSFAVSLLEIANQRPPMMESAVKAMFTVGTEGCTEMFADPSKWSDTFKEFLGLCLKMDPEERATAEQLLSHPFIKKADTRANMENILRRIFLGNSLLHAGF